MFRLQSGRKDRVSDELCQFAAISLIHCKSVQCIGGRDQHVLFAIDHESHGRVARVSGQTGVPKNLAILRIESNEVISIACKQQVARRRQHSDNAIAAWPIVPPDGVTCFVIDREQRAAFIAGRSVHTTPALRTRVGVGEVVHAEVLVGSYIEEAGLRAITGGRPIRTSVGSR